MLTSPSRGLTGAPASVGATAAIETSRARARAERSAGVSAGTIWRAETILELVGVAAAT